MRQALNTSKLAGAWSTFRVAFGGNLGHGAPLTVQRPPYSAVRVRLRMGQRPGEFRITLQPDGRVAGLRSFTVQRTIPPKRRS